MLTVFYRKLFCRKGKYCKGVKQTRLVELLISFVILAVVIMFVFPVSAYSKMFMWKNLKGTYTIEEEKPAWWPSDKDCIVWVSGKKNKVADEVKTKEASEGCKKTEDVKKDALQEGWAPVEEENNEEVAPQENDVIKPTDREIRIFCASQEDRLRFIHVTNPEELSNKKICKKFNISEGELNDIYSKVTDYTKGISPCSF
ncbi:MAG: hypothetical protein D3924_13650 [Candidatus Electrothrix sp. AR4]|nr:hypothetical protein [Candidatus Electrothrix sp. AR4]